MKKRYALLASALFLSVAGFSQQNMKALPEAQDNMQLKESLSKQKLQPINKAYEDTLAYFDFNGGIPTGWTVVNNSNNLFEWYWTDSVGVELSYAGVNFAAPTAANGFMYLPSRKYNPSTPYTGMDTYFESGPIAITNTESVLIRYFELLRFWSPSNDGKIELLVKTNLDTNWHVFDASHGLQVNQYSYGTSEINITEALMEPSGVADTIWLRFYQQQYSHYMWLVDDIAVVEGPAHDLILDNFYTQYEGYKADRLQFYEQVPFPLFDTMYAIAEIINNGGQHDTNSTAIYRVTKQLDCKGNPDTGTFVTTEALPIIPSTDTVTVQFKNGWMPTERGAYTVAIEAQNSSVEQEPADNVLQNSFIVSDTVYAKDDGSAEEEVGPGSFTGLGKNGSRMALYYDLSSAQNMTSVSYYIMGDAIQGTSFTAKVYSMDTTINGCNIDESGWFADASFPTGKNNTECFTNVATSLTTVQVDSTMDSTWVNVMFTNFLGQPAPISLPAGQYIVGLEASGFVANPNFPSSGPRWNAALTLGVDRDADAQGTPGTGLIDYGTVVFLYDATSTEQKWGFAYRTPMIRMNFGQLPDSCMITGLEEANTTTDFGIYPNPSNGQFNLEIATESAKDYTLTVANMLGQNVYTEEISLNNEMINKNMNLSHLEKGIYFVTLQNANERETLKIVIR